MNWDEYFINIAEQVKLKSKDINTQIGVVVVGKDNSIVSTGYNSFARGINDDIDERQEKPEKYFWFEHAERNAIYNAARIGVSLKYSTMYLTCGMSCSDCTRGIINSGIKRVYLERGGGAKGVLWDEHEKRSIEMFKEAGVEIIFYDEL